MLAAVYIGSIPARIRIFFLATTFKPSLVTTQSPKQCALVALSLVLKRLEPERNKSSKSNVSIGMSGVLLHAFMTCLYSEATLPIHSATVSSEKSDISFEIYIESVVTCYYGITSRLISY